MFLLGSSSEVILTAKILILLLLWVGDIDIKDQLSPTEVEIGPEFGNFKC